LSSDQTFGEPTVIRSHDDVRPFGLDATAERQLVAEQNECVFTWITQDGSPMGVVMSYVAKDGKLWLTGSRFRKRFRALARDARALIVISSAGTKLGAGLTVSYKGSVILHDDPETKAWFYPALATRLHADRGAEYMADFVRFLDTPNRIIIEFAPGRRVGFDDRKFQAATDRSRSQNVFDR
jgi:Pyridoxamine 5'-phosphate oxidase